MKISSSQDIHRIAIATVGLDPDITDLNTPEGLAALMRRIAGFRCPCPKSTLIRTAASLLKGLEGSDLIDSIDDMLESMISHGDFLEEKEILAPERISARTVLYCTPPSFVWLNTSALLIGIAPEWNSPIPDNSSNQVQFSHHVRRVIQSPNQNLRLTLKQIGLIEISIEKWLKQPSLESPSVYLHALESQLEETVGEFQDVVILNSDRPVNYYKGRWEPLADQTGQFVARRPQRYGNDLWCYISAVRGSVKRAVDFPREIKLRGCDEAWHVQAAIDLLRGHPQEFELVLSTGFCVFKFNSPVPQWAKKRWDIFGEPVQQSKCLFAYRFPIDHLYTEIEFIEKNLWIHKRP